ncbi:MAG: hypothetical protein J6R74_01240, partial [Tidjanibacter sp.]|nr:hypothetical protein [Tidjanibacter sp.]
TCDDEFVNDWEVNGNTVTVYLSENTEIITRTATIKVTYGKVFTNVTIKQDGKPGASGTVILSEQFDNTNTNIDGTAITAATFPNFSGSFNKAYKGFGGIKLGTSSVVGYITSKTLDLSSKFTVQLDAGRYKANTTEISVTVGSQTKTISNAQLSNCSTTSDGLTTFILEFEAATASSTVKISTTSNGKRALIDNVIITKY